MKEIRAWGTQSLSFTPVGVHMRGWKPRDGKALACDYTVS